MALGNSVVKGCVALAVGGVQGAPVLEKEEHHGRGTGGGGAMDGVLTTTVADASGCWRFAFDEKTGDIQVLLGSHEVEGSLLRQVISLEEQPGEGLGGGLPVH